MMWFFIILGLLILVSSGDFLVRGSVALANIFKISPYIIAATFVAFGTSAPELAISVNSALKGLQGITLGNIAGSNIANILFAIPLAFLIKISKKSDVKKKDSLFLFAITVVFSTMVILGKNFELIYGVLSLIILISYILIIIYILII